MDKPAEKRGRGRPKGTCGSVFVEVRLRDIKNRVNDDSIIIVGKKWLTELGYVVKEGRVEPIQPMQPTEKIQYTIYEDV